VVEKKEFARGEKRNEESEKQLLKPLVKKGLIFKRQSDKKKQKTTKTKKNNRNNKQKSDRAKKKHFRVFLLNQSRAIFPFGLF
jgi:hypothetical protein